MAKAEVMPEEQKLTLKDAESEPVISAFQALRSAVLEIYRSHGTLDPWSLGDALEQTDGLTGKTHLGSIINDVVSSLEDSELLERDSESDVFEWRGHGISLVDGPYYRPTVVSSDQQQAESS